MKLLARLLFEASPWSPFWTVVLVGYATVGADGQVYRTADGQAYLDSLDEGIPELRLA